MGSKAISPMCKISWHVKNPAEYERGISSAKFTTSSSQVFPDLLQGVFADVCQRALVYESRMIRTQMGTHNRSESGHIARNTSYDITP
jgi:hypothetical protein